MATALERRRARYALDERSAELRQQVGLFLVPNAGWVRAIRNALGMSAEQLASRMNVSTTSVRSMEANERTGRVQLATLQRAADALDCDLVYALVPRQSLDRKVEEQAINRVSPALSRLERTMLLEDQSPSAQGRARLLQEAIDAAIDRPGLWDAD